MGTMRTYARHRALLAMLASGGLLAGLLSSCNLNQITTTQTVTLNTRDVIAFLLRSALLTPIETAVNNGINNLLDKLDDNNDEG